jgi:hypothetical protein
MAGHEQDDQHREHGEDAEEDRGTAGEGERFHGG